MNEKIRILHFADLHLGSEFLSLSGKTADRINDLKAAFLKIITTAKEKRADIILGVGDIFDSWSVSEDLISLVREGFASIPDIWVIIAAGNHDPLTFDCAYLRPNFWSENVIIMPELFSSVLIESLKTEVWGAGFSSSFQHATLLKEAIPKKPDYIQLGAVHGMVGQNSAASEYNPIGYSQIGNSKLDYLGLGHIHKPSDIGKEGKTYYAYPGCPEGRGFDELGARGVIVGDVSKSGVDLEFLPIAAREYNEATIDISRSETATEAAQEIRRELEKQFGEGYSNNIYKIILVGEAQASVKIENIKPALSDLYYLKIRDNTSVQLNLESASKEISLRGIFLRNMLDQETLDNEALQIGLKAFLGKVDYDEN